MLPVRIHPGAGCHLLSEDAQLGVWPAQGAGLEPFGEGAHDLVPGDGAGPAAGGAAAADVHGDRLAFSVDAQLQDPVGRGGAGRPAAAVLPAVGRR